MKSPIANGKCNVVSEIADAVEEERGERPVRCDWIHFLVARCSDLGSTAKALSVSFMGLAVNRKETARRSRLALENVVIVEEESSG